jgi:Na+/H+ antiporter NhaC
MLENLPFTFFPCLISFTIHLRKRETTRLKTRMLLLLFILLLIPASGAAESISIVLEKPTIVLTDVATEFNWQLTDASGNAVVRDTMFAVTGLNESKLQFTNGVARISAIHFTNYGMHRVSVPQLNWSEEIRVIPGWLSLVPPLVAIVLALLTRQVLIALFVGIWFGVSIVYDYNPFYGMLYSLTDYIGKASADPDKLSIIIFSLVLGGMVGVISKMGGTQGVVDRLARFASDNRRGQLVTWLMGIMIFFDDYANTLIVGNTMRPLSDRLRISREKLAYLVDSTAAPVANIAIISTWIGFELSLIADSFNKLGITENPYIMFFQTIPYNFYPIFALTIGLVISYTGRDFGPMLTAERRARKTGAVLAPGATPVSSLDAAEIIADENTPKLWWNGMIPISIVILTTLLGLWFTGYAAVSGDADLDSLTFLEYVSRVIGSSNSYAVLMWASFFGSISAIILAVSQRILTLENSIVAWIGGIKAMVIAALILTMAWTIGNICTDLHTADYVIELTAGNISPHFIPTLSFLVAALISFATGTSWGVMAILMPIVIPIAWHLPQTDPAVVAGQEHSIFVATIASVLAGATFGDHCSPISDTTIMSSMASGSDHIDHVRTQIPYALLGGILSIFFGYIPAGYGIGNYVSLILGLIVIVLVIRYYGKKSDH